MNGASLSKLYEWTYFVGPISAHTHTHAHNSSHTSLSLSLSLAPTHLSLSLSLSYLSLYFEQKLQQAHAFGHATHDSGYSTHFFQLWDGDCFNFVRDTTKTMNSSSGGGWGGLERLFPSTRICEPRALTRERDCVCVRERESVCVCAWEREREWKRDASVWFSIQRKKKEGYISQFSTVGLNRDRVFSFLVFWPRHIGKISERQQRPYQHQHQHQQHQQHFSFSFSPSSGTNITTKVSPNNDLHHGGNSDKWSGICWMKRNLIHRRSFIKQFHFFCVCCDGEHRTFNLQDTGSNPSGNYDNSSSTSWPTY